VRSAACAGVPAGTLHAIAARIPAETLTAAIPVTGPEGDSWTARSVQLTDSPAAWPRSRVKTTP
jgi:hypothetical protein